MKHTIKLRDATGKRFTTFINAPTRERAEEIVRKIWTQHTIVPSVKRTAR